MNYDPKTAENPYQSYGSSVAQVDVDTRVDFIRKTYLHLTAAVLGFAFIIAVALTVEPFKTPVEALCIRFLNAPFMYLIAMFGLMGVSWLCQSWAANSVSTGTQYAGLIVYTIAEAIFFLPMIWLATKFPGALQSAGVITMTVFIGLTLSVFMTKADFSFLRSGLTIATFAVLGIAICSMLFGGMGGGFLPILICGAFVVLCAGYILYHTSQVLHHYPVGFHVAASLALFASLTTMFWYVLQLVMALSGRD
jgi:FtsH-binding integral membrane protein